MATAVSPAKVAGGLSILAGLGFGPLGAYGTKYFAEHNEVWYFLGLPTYGDGPFEAIGIPTSVPLLAGFVAVCAVEVTVGALLWTRRRAGLWLSLTLLPLEAAYWIGFALPLGPILGTARTVSVIAAHRASRRTTAGVPLENRPR